VVGVNPRYLGMSDTAKRALGGLVHGVSGGYVGDPSQITAPATDAAREWEGWGTALKPAHEPIVMARKPLIGTVAANVLQHGTGALNIDGARVDMGDEYDPAKIQRQSTTPNVNFGASGLIGKEIPIYNARGRWPANVITDGSIDTEWVRYFYCAKPSKAERNAGLEGLPEQSATSAVGMGKVTAKRWGDADQIVYERKTTHANHHPTVKPLALMRYLVRLVTPPGGTVLEPFAGSGTTLAAAILEGFNVIGCELTADYLPIIEGRIAWAQQQYVEAHDNLFGESA
jgi:hypothetical protein